MRNDPMDDKLTLFRQQVWILFHFFHLLSSCWLERALWTLLVSTLKVLFIFSVTQQKTFCLFFKSNKCIQFSRPIWEYFESSVNFVHVYPLAVFLFSAFVDAMQRYILAGSPTLLISGTVWKIGTTVWRQPWHVFVGVHEINKYFLSATWGQKASRVEKPCKGSPEDLLEKISALIIQII